VNQIKKIIALGLTLCALGAIGVAPKALACGGFSRWQPSAEEIERERVQQAVLTFFQERRNAREFLQINSVDMSGESARVTVLFAVPGRRQPRMQTLSLAQRDGGWTVIASRRPTIFRA
jgi:hypothetical protein